jgi:hypothetical protein
VNCLGIDQIRIPASLRLATVAMSRRGRWPNDMVAAGALFAWAVAVLVPTGDVFAGFGQPAVVTVASASRR